MHVGHDSGELVSEDLLWIGFLIIGVIPLFLSEDSLSSPLLAFSYIGLLISGLILIAGSFLIKKKKFIGFEPERDGLLVIITALFFQFTLISLTDYIIDSVVAVSTYLQVALSVTGLLLVLILFKRPMGHILKILLTVIFIVLFITSFILDRPDTSAEFTGEVLVCWPSVLAITYLNKNSLLKISAVFKGLIKKENANRIFFTIFTIMVVAGVVISFTIVHLNYEAFSEGFVFEDFFDITFEKFLDWRHMLYLISYLFINIMWLYWARDLLKTYHEKWIRLAVLLIFISCAVCVVQLLLDYNDNMPSMFLNALVIRCDFVSLVIVAVFLHIKGYSVWGLILTLLPVSFITIGPLFGFTVFSAAADGISYLYYLLFDYIMSRGYITDGVANE